jgi:hypothetical protein
LGKRRRWFERQPGAHTQIGPGTVHGCHAVADKKKNPSANDDQNGYKAQTRQDRE